MEPARALVLASSVNDTVADLASKLILADSLLREFRLFVPVATSACTSILNLKY